MTLQELIQHDEVEVIIDDFGHRGEGYVRLEDGWLSVPGALPGERVRVGIGRSEVPKSRRVFGRLLSVVRPAEIRHDPHCERDRECSGCQLRPMTPAAELEFKVRQVKEVLEKFAGMPREDQPHVDIISPHPFARGEGFRVRTSLTYRRRGEKYEIGLTSTGSNTLIPMAGCPALTAPLQRTVRFIEKAFGSLSRLPFDRHQAHEARGADEVLLTRIRVATPLFGHGFVDLHLRRGRSGQSVEHILNHSAMGNLARRLDELLPSDVGVGLKLGGVRHHIRGPRRIRLPVGDLHLEVGFDDWFHATLLPAEALYEALMDRLLDLDEETSLLDAGCGIGTISILAARRATRVVGFDINQGSVECAEINAAANDAFNARFFCAGWEKGLRDLAMKGEQFECVTINPMREPLGRRPLSYLRRLGARQLIYLGPSPTSAAHDIAELIDMGWRLKTLATANLHPATYHGMLVAELRRGERPNG